MSRVSPTRDPLLARVMQRLPAVAIIQQFGWLAGAKIIQGVASLAAALVVARALGPAGFGTLSLAIAIASFVALLAALGLEQIATRELAASSGQPSRLLMVLRRLRLGGALSGAILLIGIAFLPSIRELGAATLVLVLALLPIAQVGDMAEWRLLAAGHGRRVAIAVVIVSPAAAVLRCLLAWSGHGPVAFAWMLVAEWAARSVLLAWLCRDLDAGGQQPGGDGISLRQSLDLLRESTPVLLAGVAVFVYMRIDQFMIAGLLGTRQVGLYSAVVTLAELPLVVPVLLLRAALPALSRMSADGIARRDRELVKLIGLAVYAHGAIAGVLMLLAEPLVVLLYGETYRAAAEAFRIQVLAAPLVAMGVLSTAWLVLERKTGHALRRSLFGAVANVLLNLWWIPLWGIAGAALATVIAQWLATYMVDVLFAQTRPLFLLKTRALWPGNWR